MSEVIHHGRQVTDYTDPAVKHARDVENVFVGDTVVRHRRSSRLIHWAVALTFVLLLVTGLPIFSPVFGWMATLVGGLAVCRWLHPYTGLAFSLASLVMFVHWAKEMVLKGDEKKWLGPKMLEYMRFSDDDQSVGKYNGGQKLLFWAAELACVGLLLSGLVLWFPLAFPAVLREASILLHDFTFLCFFVLIVGHVYLGTAAEPGTFSGMTRGTVKRDWVKLHHPAWYREMTAAPPLPAQADLAPPAPAAAAPAARIEKK